MARVMLVSRSCNAPLLPIAAMVLPSGENVSGSRTPVSTAQGTGRRGFVMFSNRMVLSVALLTASVRPSGLSAARPAE